VTSAQNQIGKSKCVTILDLQEACPFCSRIRSLVGAQHYCAPDARAPSVKSMQGGYLLFVAGGSHFEDCEEGFLRDIDLADAVHALFAFFLFLEKFAFA
jgi:hypothetical protein